MSQEGGSINYPMSDQWDLSGAGGTAIHPYQFSSAEEWARYQEQERVLRQQEVEWNKRMRAERKAYLAQRTIPQSLRDGFRHKTRRLGWLATAAQVGLVLLLLAVVGIMLWLIGVRSPVVAVAVGMVVGLPCLVLSGELWDATDKRIGYAPYERPGEMDGHSLILG